MLYYYTICDSPFLSRLTSQFSTMTSSHYFIISVEGFRRSRQPQGRRDRSMSKNMTETTRNKTKANDDSNENDEQQSKKMIKTTKNATKVDDDSTENDE